MREKRGGGGHGSSSRAWAVVGRGGATSFQAVVGCNRGCTLEAPPPYKTLLRDCIIQPVICDRFQQLKMLQQCNMVLSAV